MQVFYILLFMQIIQKANNSCKIYCSHKLNIYNIHVIEIYHIHVN